MREADIKLHAAGFASILLTLGGCNWTPYPHCRGPRSWSPNEECYAYYYKADAGSGGLTTQALISCSFGGSPEIGGNIFAYHNDVPAGIGFRWVSSRELEVFLSPQAEGAAEVIGETRTAVYMGNPIQYHFLALSEEHEATVGCEPS